MTEIKLKEIFKYIKINKKTTAFRCTEIEKHTFYYHKNPISMDDVDIHKIIVSIKISLSKRVLNILLVPKILKKWSYYI